ncbi:MAG: Holliday junction branch migration protein RuvA [Patescibacteria group bacterium]
MISSLSGTIRHKEFNSLIIDVAGVGYKVSVPTDLALEVTPSSPIFLWTHLVVRETALELFGFLEKETLDTFELLITISGIGPKTALGILNVATPEMLRQAVASADTSYLTRVSGIGKKNAEKIVLELKDKLKLGPKDASTSSAQARSEGDALEALVSLGYTERDAREALKKVPKDVSGAGERVKAALKLLANS